MSWDNQLSTSTHNPQYPSNQTNTDDLASTPPAGNEKPCNPTMHNSTVDPRNQFPQNGATPATRTLYTDPIPTFTVQEIEKSRNFTENSNFDPVRPILRAQSFDAYRLELDWAFPDPGPLRSDDPSEVVSGLFEAGFETWEILKDITERDMQAIGMKLGHRRRLQREIATSRGHPMNAALEQSVTQIMTQDPRRPAILRRDSAMGGSAMTDGFPWEVDFVSPGA
ncbi:hypothetical protein DL98DRAFT_531583 [Cadophora sp. DSE1049]|nr:hypothetical protein DL98DRAFT_531583 [Cadophora sp. DSE1049]